MHQEQAKNKVQRPKSKRFNTSRPKLAHKQTGKPLNRLKSNHDVEPTQAHNSITGKPRSSLGSRRPLSSKQTQSAQSATTTTSGKSESQIKGMIENIFQKSKLVKDYLFKESLDENEALESLLSNDLFTLSLVTATSNKDQDETMRYVERSTVKRIEKNVLLGKQKRKCDQVANKIESMIDQRLKALSQYI